MVNSVLPHFFQEKKNGFTYSFPPSWMCRNDGFYNRIQHKDLAMTFKKLNEIVSDNSQAYQVRAFSRGEGIIYLHDGKHFVPLTMENRNENIFSDFASAEIHLDRCRADYEHGKQDEVCVVSFPHPLHS